MMGPRPSWKSPPPARRTAWVIMNGSGSCSTARSRGGATSVCRRDCAPPPTPTRTWTASSTTLTASNSLAKACAARAASGLKPLDQTSSPVRQNPSVSEPRHPGGIIPLRWAALSRNPGRHYPVTPGRLRRNRHRRRTGKAWVRCTTTIAYCAPALIATRRIVGRATASQIASASTASFSPSLR